MDQRNVVELTPRERQIIAEALVCKRNYIETGSICLAACDINEDNEKDLIKQGIKVRPLHVDQMRYIVEVHDLVVKMAGK